MNPFMGPHASDVAVRANVGLLGNCGSSLRVLEAKSSGD
jgi:hypothetical protein